MSATIEVSISDARQHLAELVRRVADSHQPVFLARRGHRVAALIEADTLERILDLAEDMEDILAAEEARREMRETGATPIPWEQVRADLGLV